MSRRLRLAARHLPRAALVSRFGGRLLYEDAIFWYNLRTIEYISGTLTDPYFFSVFCSFYSILYFFFLRFVLRCSLKVPILFFLIVNCCNFFVIYADLCQINKCRVRDPPYTCSLLNFSYIIKPFIHLVCS